MKDSVVTFWSYWKLSDLSLRLSAMVRSRSFSVVENLSASSFLWCSASERVRCWPCSWVDSVDSRAS